VRIFTDLDLNDQAAVRKQPELGEWGPAGVVTTRKKRRARWLWPVAAVAVAAVLFFVGYTMWFLVMRQCWWWDQSQCGT
jgi:hypothetical protein